MAAAGGAGAGGAGGSVASGLGGSAAGVSAALASAASLDAAAQPKERRKVFAPGRPLALAVLRISTWYLTTFGCMEWESDLFMGVMCARCYPFKMPKHCFHKFNPQVIIC